MKHLFTFFACICLFSLQGNEPQKNFKPAGFMENKGQVSDQHRQPRPDVLFTGSNGNLVYHLRQQGISYQLGRVDLWKEETNDLKARRVPAQMTIYRIDMEWQNSN